MVLLCAENFDVSLIGLFKTSFVEFCKVSTVEQKRELEAR